MPSRLRHLQQPSPALGAAAGTGSRLGVAHPLRQSALPAQALCTAEQATGTLWLQLSPGATAHTASARTLLASTTNRAHTASRLPLAKQVTGTPCQQQSLVPGAAVHMGSVLRSRKSASSSSSTQVHPAQETGTACQWQSPAPGAAARTATQFSPLLSSSPAQSAQGTGTPCQQRSLASLPAAAGQAGKSRAGSASRPLLPSSTQKRAPHQTTQSSRSQPSWTWPLPPGLCTQLQPQPPAGSTAQTLPRQTQGLRRGACTPSMGTGTRSGPPPPPARPALGRAWGALPSQHPHTLRAGSLQAHCLTGEHCTGSLVSLCAHYVWPCMMTPMSATQPWQHGICL